MVDTGQRLEAVREIGKIAVELLAVGFEPATYGCPEDDEGNPILEEDERYWDNLLELRDVLEQLGEVEVEHQHTQGETNYDLFVERNHESGLKIAMEVSYYPDGQAYIGGSVTAQDGPRVLVIDGFSDELSVVDVGRLVARAELSILASIIESSGETLDYWVVEESPFLNNDYTQSKWADVRGVSRQAINKQIRSAKEKLGAAPR